MTHDFRDVLQMGVWRQTFILCCVLNWLVSSAPSSVLHNKYNNSFHLTWSTRTRVQQLEKKYVSVMLHLRSLQITAVKALVGSFYCHAAFLVQKEQQLGDRHFEDRSRQLVELPSLSTDFYVWLKLTVSISLTLFPVVHLSECSEECLTSC